MLFDINKLDTFPTQPGVYLMKNAAGDILYVGKAKNLRVRVKQYFLPGRDGREMIPFLIAHVTHVETIVVLSEKEALLLENTLIKKHLPRYNALLKDDKTYIALKITTKKTWPRLEIARYRGKPKPDGQYFGPYTSAFAARRTFDLLQRLFPLRQCSDQEFARRTRPCILYDMKRCIAPCVNKCTKEEYDQLVNQTAKFLRGQDKDVVKELYEEMHQASDKLEFEKAGALLGTIRHIESTIEKQHVDKPLGIDMDVLGIFREAGEVILSQLLFRGGKLVGTSHFNFTNIAENDEELLESFILQHYEKQDELPHEILIPVAVGDASLLGEILGTNRVRKVQVILPQRGDKKSLLEMAYRNAETTFKKEKDAQAILDKTLIEMQEKLKLTRYPEVMECFDNSNISGTEPVSVMVAFVDGKKDSKRYRKYKVKTQETPDDYGTMYEVLSRRYKRAEEEKNLPDLLIVDGGKGHLNIALRVMQELNIVSIDVIAVAKEEGRHDKGATQEQVFLPNVKDPILLRQNSPILFLLQRIRDEAHRFAITFHRKRRSKATLKSKVDEIPGIGPVKRGILLRHFGSFKKIMEATEEQLRQVQSLSDANVKAILAFQKTST